MSSFYTSVILQGSNILYRGYENGRKVKRKIKYRPYLFLEGGEGKTNFTNLAGNPVYRKDFEDPYKARDFIKKYEDVEGFEYFGMEKFQYVYIHDNFPDKIEYDTSLITVAIIDIEVKSDQGMPKWENPIWPVTAITMKVKNRVIAFGLGDYKPSDSRCVYIKCANEAELLEKFLQTWERYEPDVVTGWNTDGFDIPYIISRLDYLFGEGTSRRLSPWGRIDQKRTFFHGKETIIPTIGGVASLDCLLLFTNQKFQQKKTESNKLDVVAHEILKKRKLDYSEYEGLNDLYLRNHQLFMEYNVRDVLLVDELDQTLNLLQFLFSMAYGGKVLFEDVLGSVRQWDVLAYNYLADRGIVIPAMKHADKEQLIGGFVLEPKVGRLKWGVSFDLDGLYPHLIMQINISPETYVGRLIEAGGLTIDDVLAGKLEQHADLLRERNVSIAANMALYTKEKRGFLPELMEHMYAERKAAKDAMKEAKKRFQKAVTAEEKAAATLDVIRFDLEQKGVKVNMNAAYGCLTNQHFRFFSHVNAEAITTSGRVAINWLIKRVNDYINKVVGSQGTNYIIAADTDSMYIDFEALVDKVFGKEGQAEKTEKIINFLDKFCEEHLTPHIKKVCQDLADYLNSFEQKMNMKRESIFDSAVWVAKKMYILHVWDKEGVRYKTPEIEIKGLKAVKSDTPIVCREKIKKTIELIMRGTEDQVIDFVEEFRKDFYKLPFEDVATPSGVNGLEDYIDAATIYKKGTTAHIRGSLVYNHLLKERGINTFEEIFSGDRIKTAYLRVPNPIHQDVIACPKIMPKQFEIDGYIDYERQFEKGYLSPVKAITDVIGWKTERVASVDGFLS